MKQALPSRSPNIIELVVIQGGLDLTVLNNKSINHKVDKVATASERQYRCSTYSQSFASDLVLESHSCSARPGAAPLKRSTRGRVVAAAPSLKAHHETASRRRKYVSCPT